MRPITVFFFLSLFVIAALIGSSGCTARRLQENQVLLKKVVIKCDNPDISKDEMFGYLKQKPNRKLFGLNSWPWWLRLKRGSVGKKNLLVDGAGYPFYLAIYNLVNPKREKNRQLRRDARYKKRYEHYQLHYRRRNGTNRRPPKKRKTIGEFLWSIGEAPVVIDSSKTNRSVHQLELYLDNKGYKYSVVKDTVVYPLTQRHRQKKAIICYIVKPAQPYKVDSIAWDIRDPNIAYDLLADKDSCRIHRGDNFDRDIFESERERITTVLRNRGYFKFSKDFVVFYVDTALGRHAVNVTIIINKNQVFNPYDSTVIRTNHQRYDIRHVYVKSLYDLSQLRNDRDQAHYDTTMYQNIAFLRNMDSLFVMGDTLHKIPVERVLKFKPEVLAQRISMQPGALYRQLDYEATYRQLVNLRVFRQVVIEPVEVGPDKLDIYVKLLPIPRQSFTTQFEGTTNSGASLGIGGSYVYQNNNLFRGAELLDIGLKGGTEIQKSIGGSSQTNSQIGFNTIQAGVDASLNIPREPFKFLVKANKREEDRFTQDRRTLFNSSFNYERRIDYFRSLGNLSFGYSFRMVKRTAETNEYKDYGKLAIFPIELNVVNVTPQQGLLVLLQNPDPLLHYRFTDHLINDARVTWLYTRPERKTGFFRRTSRFLKIDLEVSGMLTRAAFKLANATPDANDSYRIGGIPFSQYFRYFVDWRVYWNIGTHEQIVFRIAQGAGFTGKNFLTLPLEKSFYGGGANDIRAWEARSLGPGTYIIPADQKYAQFGDVLLEYNIELRFPITKTLKGALFMDGGNIWLMKRDSIRPGADFVFKDGKFLLQDLAFGPGVGLRYDLSFFIIRLDWAMKLRDPAQPYGDRWYVGQRKMGSNLNFGIGYPF